MIIVKSSDIVFVSDILNVVRKRMDSRRDEILP